MTRILAPHFPPLPSANHLSFSVFQCVAGRACWLEREGRSLAWSQTMWPRKSLVLYKSANTLWADGTHKNMERDTNKERETASRGKWTKYSTYLTVHEYLNKVPNNLMLISTLCVYLAMALIWTHIWISTVGTSCGSVHIYFEAGSEGPNSYGSGRIRILPGHFCVHWKKYVVI